MKRIIVYILFISFFSITFAQEDIATCTKEYVPVCGLQEIQCITTPCNPIEQTFNNRCLLDANDGATYLHDGPCKEPIESLIQSMFAQKFEKSFDQVQVTINHLSATHIQGLVSIMEGLGVGGKFLAVHKDNNREIVRYGDRAYEKEVIETYAFPIAWFADQDVDEPLIFVKSQKEAEQEAIEYIKNMEQYTMYNGHEIKLVDTLVMRCPGCWMFTYEFFLTQEKEKDTTHKAIVEISFGNGEIIDVNYVEDIYNSQLQGCRLYYDGCNTCGVENGKLTYCTEMYCMEPEAPKCLEYTIQDDVYIQLKKEIDVYIKEKLNTIFTDKTYNQKIITLQKVILNLNAILSDTIQTERQKKLYVFILDSLQSYKTNLQSEDFDTSTQVITQEELLEREIKKMFMQKYHKSIDAISIRIVNVQEDHMRGEVNFANGGPGDAGLFLATKIDGIWEIVFDGNGSYDCDLVQQYNFPQAMISDCY